MRKQKEPRHIWTRNENKIDNQSLPLSISNYHHLAILNKKIIYDMPIAKMLGGQSK